MVRESGGWGTESRAIKLVWDVVKVIDFMCGVLEGCEDMGSHHSSGLVEGGLTE